ncbi:hypothetical protein D3C80_1888790 [compost metagenome]
MEQAVPEGNSLMGRTVVHAADILQVPCGNPQSDLHVEPDRANEQGNPEATQAHEQSDEHGCSGENRIFGSDGLQ